MSVRSFTLPAMAISLAGLLTGCLDSAQSPSSGALPVAASTASQTWSGVCDGCGSNVAFKSVSDPSQYFGWTLDPAYSPQPSGGKALRRVTYQGNTVIPGGLVDIDLHINSQIYGVNSFGGLFVNTNPFIDNQPWTQISTPASARRVATGSGPIWILTTENSVYGGFKLYFLNSSNQFQNVAAGLVEIDVDNNGDLWGVGGDGKVYRLPGGNPSAQWENTYPWTDALNVACGGGQVYITTTATTAGGNTIKKWNGSSFAGIPGGVKDIMVDDSGRLWASNNADNVFYYNP